MSDSCNVSPWPSTASSHSPAPLISRPGRERKGRLGSSKSRFGCLTCKIRRVKCDEGRPSCHRCTSTGRRCDGYPLNQHVKRKLHRCDFSVVQTTVTYALQSFHPHATPTERRAFDYYYCSAAPLLSSVADLDFWCQVVPQLCQSEPVIWDAVVSIGCLYEMSSNSKSMKVQKLDPMNTSYHTAITCYNRAINRINHGVVSTASFAPLALLTSVLFVCIEIIQDNIPQTLSLVKSSAKLLRYINSSHATDLSNSPSLTSIVHQTTPLLRLLSGLAAAFGDGEPFRLYTDSIQSQSVAQENEFFSLKEARDTLDSITPSAYHLHVEGGKYKYESFEPQQKASLLTRQQQIAERLEDWLSKFRRFSKASILSAQSHQQQQLIALLFKEHAVATILTDTCFSTLETDFDSYYELFESIINNIAAAMPSEEQKKDAHILPKTPFRFASGNIPTLCFVIRLCRYPKLRARALALIEASPHKDGLWKSSAVARVMERLIECEEKPDQPRIGCIVAGEMHYLPVEENRIHSWKVLKQGWELIEDFSATCEKEGIIMMITRYSVNGFGVRQMVEELVPL